MGCVEVAEGVIVCRPSSVTIRAVRVCPACGERRRQVGMCAVWYDTIWTCLGCGDDYSCEGIHPRPFARGWRDRERFRARRMWAEAPPRAEANAALAAMLADVLVDLGEKP